MSSTHPFPPLAGIGKDEWLDKASPSVVSVAWSHGLFAGIAKLYPKEHGFNPPISENSLGFVYLPAYPKLICSTTRRRHSALIGARVFMKSFTTRRCCPGLFPPAFQRDSLASFETSTVRCRARKESR